MPWISERTFDAIANVLPKLVERLERIAPPNHTDFRSISERIQKMEEELKALAEAIAEDRSANNSARKLIEDLAAKIESVTATLPANFRNQLIALTADLRNNSKELADAVTKNTKAESEPAPAEPAPAPVNPVPAPAEPAPAEPAPPAEPKP